MGRSTSSAPVRSYDATRRRRVRAGSRSHARNVRETPHARLVATDSSRRATRTSAARSAQSGAADWPRCVADHTRLVSSHRLSPVPPDTGTSGAGGGAAITARSDDPTMTKLKVTWSKEQLKNAPDFQYYKPPARTTRGGGGSPTSDMAPRPTSPT